MADKKISQLTAATTPLAGTEVLPIVQSGSTVKVSAADVTAGRAVSASSVAVTGSTAPANGVYLPATNSVGISTAGGNAVYINSSGNVSIAGGNPPTQTFNLYRSGSTQTVMAAGNSNTGLNGTYFGVDTAGNAIINQTQSLALNLQTAGVTRLSASAVGDVTVSTGNLVIGTAAKGIDFSANTGAAGMTSELLNWYEEGTWTTTLGVGVTVNSGSWAATATYTRIGRTVFWNVVQTSGDISASAGIEIFSGLPFPPARASSCTYTNNAASLAGVGLTETNSKVYVAVAITAQTALRFSGMYEV